MSIHFVDLLSRYNDNLDLPLPMTAKHGAFESGKNKRKLP
jgi:hypothetical protein